MFSRPIASRGARFVLLRGLAALILLASAGAAFADGCVDAFRVTFGVKLKDTPVRLSLPHPFKVNGLPALMETSFDDGLLSANVQRVSDDALLVEFRIVIGELSRVSFYRVSMDKDHPKTLRTEVVDEFGDAWHLNMSPACSLRGEA